MTTRLRPALAAALLAAAGCGGPVGTVTGDVSYEGEPVKRGYITFTPADGKGPAVAAEIAGGRFKLENVAPGPKVVLVEAGGEGPSPSVQSSEDMEKLSRQLKGKAIDPTGIIRTELVPPDADGNNRAVDVAAGPQELSFALKKPAKRK